jgi:sulfotransferase
MGKRKEIFFINGMPRSGSTLLCNILAQNPDFHVTATSGLPDIISNIHSMWQQNPAIKASEPTEKQLRIMNGIFQSYHSDTDRPIIFNKSRGWSPLIELVELALNRPMKILTTTRKITSILASFEKLYRQELKNIDSPMRRTPEMAVLSGRLNVWANSVVGGAFNSIQDACLRGHRSKFLFVDYDSLTTSPESEMRKIYAFLEKPLYTHDFNNVQQYTHENDTEHGFTDLHTIRPRISPQLDDSREILGPFYDQFSGYHYNF